MSQDIPKTTKQWYVAAEGTEFDRLTFTDAEIPELGDNEALVKCNSSFTTLPQDFVC